MKHIRLDDEAHRVAKAAAAHEGLGLERWIAIAIALAAKTTASSLKDERLAGDARRLHDRRTYNL